MSAQLYLLSQSEDHPSALQKILQLPWHNNPDLLQFNTDQTGLKIEQVRDLLTQLPYRPYTGSSRYFVLYHFEQTTLEAQNALLKSIEEPPEYVNFVLTATQTQNILPTIQSRCLISRQYLHPDQLSPELQTQLTQLYQQVTSSPNWSTLIEIAGELKDRDSAIELITNLITYLHQHNQTQPNLVQTLHLQTLTQHLNYLHQNSNVVLTLESAFFEMKRVLENDTRLTSA